MAVKVTGNLIPDGTFKIIDFKDIDGAVTASSVSSSDKVMAASHISTSGDITSSGVIYGSGAGLHSIPASSVVDLNLNKIENGIYSASITSGSHATESSFTLNLNMTSSADITSSGVIYGNGSGLHSISASAIDGLNLTKIKNGIYSASIVSESHATSSGLIINTNISSSGVISGSNFFKNGVPLGTSNFVATNVASDILPTATADSHSLGSSSKKWHEVHAINSFFGGIHEINLETKGIGKLPEGTILVYSDAGLIPCNEEADYLVMGVSSPGTDCPIVLGAEPVLVDGPISAGDFIITSNRKGYGKAAKLRELYTRNYLGKVIAQSLEDSDGGLVKAMIRKM